MLVELISMNSLFTKVSVFRVVFKINGKYCCTCNKRRTNFIKTQRNPGENWFRALVHQNLQSGDGKWSMQSVIVPFGYHFIHLIHWELFLWARIRQTFIVWFMYMYIQSDNFTILSADSWTISSTRRLLLSVSSVINVNLSHNFKTYHHALQK